MVGSAANDSYSRCTATPSACVQAPGLVKVSMRVTSGCAWNGDQTRRQSTPGHRECLAVHGVWTNSTVPVMGAGLRWLEGQRKVPRQVPTVRVPSERQTLPLVSMKSAV